MRAAELKRMLEALGCEMEDGTRHWIVTYRGIKTTIPRHPSKEIRTGTSQHHQEARHSPQIRKGIFMEYPVLFEPQPEGGYLITFPDFDWGISQGDAEGDSRMMATALLQTMIQKHIRDGEPLPKASRLRGRKYRLIRLPAMQAAKAELYRQFRASGLRKIDLASRMGIPKTVVDRLFDLDHHTRMNQIEAAFEALGKRIGIVVEDAA
jgi:antitoxin HicB